MEPPPEQFRFTFLSFLVLILFALVWPALSIYFMDSQIKMLNFVLDPTLEIYIPTMLIQAFTLLLIIVTVLLERVHLNDVGFRNFNKWTLPLAIAFLLSANFFLWILQTLIAGGSPTSFADIESLLPHTGGEKIFWVILTAVVAVNEELTFRGYLITRISRLAGGRAWVGVIVSSLAFASGHVYQGGGGFVLIFIYGVMFSVLYLKTGSLYPGIIAHFIQDAIVAIIPSLAH